MKKTVMIVALLVLALGGTAVAGSKITGKHVKNGTVAGVDLRDGSVSTTDVSDSTLVTADFGQLLLGHQGSPGPEGPPGPQGAAGPTGVPGIRYEIVDRTLDQADPTEIWTVGCPSGTQVLGGGVSTNKPASVTVTQSAPAGDGRHWVAHAFNAGTQPAVGYAWAVCGNTF